MTIGFLNADIINLKWNCCNPNYVNQTYFNQKQQEITQYKHEQDEEVFNAVKACHDMLDAVRKLDEQHQEKAFNLCLTEIANAMG